jgi:hypothetical protein
MPRGHPPDQACGPLGILHPFSDKSGRQHFRALCHLSDTRVIRRTPGYRRHHVRVRSSRADPCHVSAFLLSLRPRPGYGRMQLAVLLKGSLHGMGRECTCEVLAMRNVSEGNTPDEYTDLLLLSPPSGWPDGEYALELGVLSAIVRRHNRKWIVNPAPPASLKEDRHKKGIAGAHDS